MAKEISSELLNTILTRVGGPGNIASCGNCMTRLRLGVHDSSLVDPNIKTLEGVKGVILTSDRAGRFWALQSASCRKSDERAAGRSTGTGCRRNRRPEQTSVKSQTNLRRATISRQIRHHLHAADPGFIAAGLLLGIATLIATVMHVPADAQGTLPDALNFMKVFSKSLFTSS